MMKRITFFALLFTFYQTTNFAQNITVGDNNGKVTFEEYEPKSTLVVPQHSVKKAKFPFIDVHNHQFDLDQKESNCLRSQHVVNPAFSASFLSPSALTAS